MGRWIVVACLAIMLPTLASGDSVHVQPNVVLVPTYSASSSGSAGQLAEILAELKAIRAELSALRLGGQVRPVISKKSVIQNHCAKCHSQQEADVKGAGFVLLTDAGEVTPLSINDQRRIDAKVQSGKMPPAPGRLTDEEKNALVSPQPQKEKKQ